jgi:hypothetical protein
MTDRTPSTTKNLDGYGNDAMPWARAHAELVREVTGPGVIHFLGTVGPDGRPHVAGVGAAWYDGDLYFTSSLAARKARNLATNPACTIALKAAGIDLTLMGSAARVTDPAITARLAAIYRDRGWPAQAEGAALTAPFNAPSAGPPPWHVFRCTFDTVVGVATSEPWGATRWDFAR